jgi:hypothetical protein
MEIVTPTAPAKPTLPMHWLRRTLLIGLGVVGAICALATTWWASVGWWGRQQPVGTHDIPAWVIVLTLIAILAAALALPHPARPVQKALVKAAREGHLMPWLCAALLALPTLVAVLHWHTDSLSPPVYAFTKATSSWAALLWVTGMITALIVAWPPRRDSGSASTLSQRLRSPRLVLEALAVLAILGVAAGVRLWHLESVPEGLWWDEADFARSAQRLFSMPFQPLAPGNFGHNPSLYVYVMAVLLHVGGDTVGMIRLTSALFGLVAVGAVYLLGRVAGGPALGLCAAALLAVGQWAIDFSRLGMSNIAAPAMVGLGFVALSVAMQRPRACWFALAGLLLGLSLLTYAGAFLAGVGVTSVVVGIRLVRDGPFRRAAWPSVCLLPLGLVVGAAPFLTAVWLDAGFTLGREHTTSLFNEPVCSQWSRCWPVLQESIRRHLEMLTIAGDNNGRHNLPGAPMLDPIMGACLLLGLGICLRRIGHWFSQLLLFWLIASLLGGIFSLDFEAPQGARTVGAIAPIALIAALPLALLGQAAWSVVLGAPGWFARRRSAGSGMSKVEPARRSLPLVAVLVAVGVVACPVGVATAHNLTQYFVLQATNMDAWDAMDGKQALIGHAAASLSRRGYTVLVDPSIQGDPLLTFAAGHLILHAYDPGVPVPLPVPQGGLALIIPPESQSVLDDVRDSYPTATVIPLTPNFDRAQVRATVILIHPEDAARTAGITVTFDTGTQLLTLTHQLGQVPWPPGSGPTSRAALRGTLQISSVQSWQPLAFRITGAGQAAITIDGDTWPDGTAGTLAICLGAGNHALSVAAQGQAAASLELQSAPGPACSQRDDLGPWSALPLQSLAAPELPTGGLLGLYYNGPAISGQPALVRVDSTVNTYYQEPPRGTGFPFAAQWLGYLNITEGGVYTFKLSSTGPSDLTIDGAQVVSSPSGGSGAGTVSLLPGRHSVRLRYVGAGHYLHCYLTWAPPGKDFSSIPPSVTEPAHG